MGPEGLLPKWRARAARQFQIFKETSQSSPTPLCSTLLPQIITIIPWNAGDWTSAKLRGVTITAGRAPPVVRGLGAGHGNSATSQIPRADPEQKKEYILST